MKRNRQGNIFKLIVLPIFFFSLMPMFSGPAYAVTYVYDDLNRLITAIYEDGKSLRYDDINGNLVSKKFAEADERLRNAILVLKVLTGMVKDDVSRESLDGNGDSKVRLADVIRMFQEISRR